MNISLKKFNKSNDEFLWDAEIRSSIAYAKALFKEGVINKREYSLIEKGLEEIKNHKGINSFEDIHIALLKLLWEKIGEPAKKLHTGRSRNEQVVTDERIWLKGKIFEVLNEIIEIQKTTFKIAESNFYKIFPGYTHLKQAQLILFSHYIMSLFWKMERGKERLKDALKRVDELPLGSGAIAGSSYMIDREFLKKELVFSKISENSIDAVSERNFILEVLFALCLILLDLSRYAEDFIIFSSDEFSYINFEKFGKFRSSMMPHKQNPDILELIRAKPGRIFGYLTSIFITLKGTPLSYNKDMQEDKIPLKKSVDETISTLKIFNEILKKLKVNEEKIEKKINHFVYSTDIVDYLIEKGMSFEDAYSTVKKICEFSEEEKIPFECITLKKYREFSILFEKDIYLVFSTESSVKKKKTYGSTNPVMVKLQIDKAKKILKNKKS